MSRITNKVHDSRHITRYLSISAPAQVRHFAQLPSFLFEQEAFQPLTNEGKILYTMLLRRSELSRRHGWTDSQGHVYIYFTIEETVALLHCGRQKAVDTLRELQRSGLLEIKRQGCGKPNRLYPRFYDEAMQVCDAAEDGDELSDLRKCMDEPGVQAWPDGEVLLPVLGKPRSGESGYDYPDAGFPGNGTSEV